MTRTYLKPRLEEIEIPMENPFAHCALGRGQYAQILTDVVNVYAHSGCVLALEGQWGTGKTTFVRMWRQYLANLNYHTLYFNAWETDYTADPLIAMLAELKEIGGDTESFKKVVATSGRVLLTVGKGLLKKFTGINADEVADSVTDEMEEIGQDFLKEYVGQKNSFLEFKQKLQTFVADKAAGQPIVFFIDELDRCNPAYAVKVLERVKHLFDIPNIIFVLAVNKQQLGCAIQGYFGSSQMDADEYLRRFIDIEYTLPEPDMEKYCKMLYGKYEFGHVFERRRRNGRAEHEEDNFLLETAIRILQTQQMNLRAVDKLFAHIRLVLEGFSIGGRLLPDTLFLLCFWKITDIRFYESVKNHIYTLQQLLGELERRIYASYLIHTIKGVLVDNQSLAFVIATFLCLYNTTERGATYEGDIIGYDEQRNLRFLIPLECTILNLEELGKAIEYNNRLHYGGYSLSHIFQRIDLLSPLRIS